MPLATGEELYREVKAGFVQQGTTFHQWCRSVKKNPTGVKAAVFGTWSGIKGKQVLSDVATAAGVLKS